ncbi:MAG: ParB N-terminal domain-containing protein [Brevinema sp.]
MKVQDIIIQDRIRKDLGDISQLKESIQKYGLLQPIIIDNNNHLIAGERRLRAIQELGWEDVDVLVKDVSYTDALRIEIGENTTRKDFDQEELLEGIKRYRRSHNIFLKISEFFQNIWKKIFPLQ